MGVSTPFSAMGKVCRAGLTKVGRGIIPDVPSMFTGPIVPTGQETRGHFWVGYPEAGITPPKGPVGSKYDGWRMGEGVLLRTGGTLGPGAAESGHGRDSWNGNGFGGADALI